MRAWLARSDSVYMAAWIGAGGLTFMAGNLLLAGTLTRPDFGRLALFQAILGLSVGLAPLGLDSLVVRRELQLGRASLVRVSANAGLTAAAAIAIARLVFGYDLSSAVFFGVGILGAAITRIFAAGEQAAIQLGRSQFLTQLPSFCFGALAVGLAVAQVRDWRWGAGALVAGYVVSALVGLWLGDPGRSRAGPEAAALEMDRQLWSKAVSFTGILASVLVLHHLERFVIPKVLGIEALATFAVVATLVGSPYRILHGGIGYALMPRIRAEPTAGWRLVRAELVVASTLGLGGGALLAGIAKPLIHFLYGEKYQVGFALVVAIALVGVIRLFYAVFVAALSATGDSRQLRTFHIVGWVGTTVALVGAIWLAVFGLVGVVLGAALGWVTRLVAAIALSLPALENWKRRGMDLSTEDLAQR